MNTQFDNRNIIYLNRILENILIITEDLEKIDINETYLNEASKKALTLFTGKLLIKISLEDIRRIEEKDLFSTLPMTGYQTSIKKIPNNICYKLMLIYTKKCIDILNINDLDNINKDEIIKQLINLFNEAINEITKYDLNKTGDYFIQFIFDCCRYKHFNLNELDLSKTNATLCLNNINLKIINNKRPKINCNGCNVHFYTSESYSLFEINEELFDEKTRKNNPKVFLSDTFTPEFKKKFYNRETNVQDLLELSEEQLSELNQNHFLKIIYHNNENNNLFQLLIKNIDINTIIELYTKHHDDYIYLEELFKHEKLKSYMETFICFDDKLNSYVNKDKLKHWLTDMGVQTNENQTKLKFLNNVEAKNIRKIFNDNFRAAIFYDDYIIKAIREYYFWSMDSLFQQNRFFEISQNSDNAFKNWYEEYYLKQLRRHLEFLFPSNFPEKFVNDNKDVFLLDVNIPKYIKDKYYLRNLTLKEIVEYPNIFLKKYIYNFMTNSFDHKTKLIRPYIELYLQKITNTDELLKVLNLLNELPTESIEEFTNIFNQQNTEQKREKIITGYSKRLKQKYVND